MRASVEKDKRWVTIAFTWNGLRAVGVDEGSLSTFPEEFRQGMAARAEMLGDTGGNAAENWVGGLASPDLHAIATSSRGTRPSTLAASASTRSWWRHARAWKSCLCLISMPVRRSTMRTTILGIGTDFHSRSSKAVARSRPPAQARR